MKKILFLIGCLLIGINSANALTINGDEGYINNNGAKISSEQYKILHKNNFEDSYIDKLTQDSINVYSDPKLNDESKSIYVITTYKMDRFGNVVDQYSMNATEEQAKSVATNENLHVTPNSTLTSTPSISTYGYVDNYTYATESKRVTGYYTNMDGKYVIQLWATWYKTPKIKEFDIMAVRWNNSVSISNIIGWQECDSNTGTTNYNMSSKNTKYTNNGAGISMNIHDSAKNRIELYLRVESNSYFGDDFYGTYQHARHSNANTLAISQSYTFGNGLGGVLVFSNNTYKSYYDNMEGIKYHYE